MKFSPTKLRGACIIELQPIGDTRGFFARAWCQREFEAAGLPGQFVQANLSLNRNKGTLRGLHWQVPPHAEAKLVRCIRGAIYDVIVDLRADSPTYLQWIAAELTADNHRMLLVPEGFAHGFQTLQEDAEVFYHVTTFYAPEAERGARYNDPALEIDWPLPVSTISDKDAQWPDIEPLRS
jgi:dTDP-4-dehydrorhamnose 3,5-epimerase